MTVDKKRPLRSAEWFGSNDKNGMMYRSWMKNQGIPDHEFQGKPIIGICNTWSELTPCNAHFRKIAEHVKRGIFEAGGFPVEFPVFSNGESNLRPTAMLTRNLASMDVEESIRGNPMDAVVLLVGCDKTTPALLMGAASCDVPAIVVTGGPMLNGKHEGKDLGSGTAVWQLSEAVKGGQISMHQFLAAESGMSRSAGTCNTMGTASTMACMAEALGTSLPHNAAIPAVDARRYVLAHMSGMRIVDMVWEDLRLSKILTREAFENAIRVNAAIGGSTNAVIHLKAIAARIGVPLELEDWTRIGRGTPTLVDLQPSGRFLMEEFYYAGGLPGVLRRLGEADLLPHKDALTVNGKTLWENNQEAPIYNDEVIRVIDKPLIADGGICILRGNLAPRGAVLKPSAATPELMKHRGKAVVFEDFDHYKKRINDPELEVDASSVLVMKNCGPKGYPGMAEVGNMGLPPKLLAQGIKDMVRISDARMSGTAYGTVVLHVAPEAAAGGPLGIVEDGDWIELDCEAGRLHLDISDAEMAQRQVAREAVNAETVTAHSGYQRLYIDRVLQADEGCDFDFLVGCRGSAVPKHSHPTTLEKYMLLLQFKQADGQRRIGVLEDEGRKIRVIEGYTSTYNLAQAAIAAHSTLKKLADAALGPTVLDYAAIAQAGGLLPPLDHGDSAHCYVTGTGLTHLGSADGRDAMHKKLGDADTLTDSMKMFRMGLEGGKPAAGQTGVQPEWFYKGDGSIVRAAEQPLGMPQFALDGGEEPEIAALYVIGPDGAPYRLGFAIGNEFSDHVTERQNYLYLAHSKLRVCAVGPALLVGDLPPHVAGMSRIRDSRGEVRWEKPFVSGEDNMSHTVANLEYHHFKYPLFRRPGDVHIHFFGTATLSCSDGIQVAPGETFEIDVAAFGPPLRNKLALETVSAPQIHQL